MADSVRLSSAVNVFRICANGDEDSTGNPLTVFSVADAVSIAWNKSSAKPDGSNCEMGRVDTALIINTCDVTLIDKYAELGTRNGSKLKVTDFV